MEFKEGDYVVITEYCKFLGDIGCIKYVFIGSRLGRKNGYGIEIDGKKYSFTDGEFRHATRQEAAHAIAEEICNGE
jgi:hypothetical protein